MIEKDIEKLKYIFEHKGICDNKSFTCSSCPLWPGICYVIPHGDYFKLEERNKNNYNAILDIFKKYYSKEELMEYLL